MGHRDKGKGEEGEGSWKGLGSEDGVGEGAGGLLALPPGVLSSCQEADRFPLSGLESACAVFSYTAAPACPFICSTRPVRARMSSLQPGRRFM